MIGLDLTEREFATVLAALRSWRDRLAGDGSKQAERVVLALAESAGEAMGAEEVDQLIVGVGVPYVEVNE